MQNFELHSFTAEIVCHMLQGSQSRQGDKRLPSGALCNCVCFFLYKYYFFHENSAGRKVGDRTSLHSLVEVTSFVGAKRVEGGHNKLPIKGAARQQPLSLFGVTRVGVLYKHLLDTQRTCG